MYTITYSEYMYAVFVQQKVKGRRYNIEKSSPITIILVLSSNNSKKVK